MTNFTTIDSRLDYINVLKKVATAIVCIIFILGIIGNGLVIWIAGFRMKKTISAVWFLNLAIADFLCCLALPLDIADLAAFDVCTKSRSSEILCLIDIILLNICMSASVLLLTAMSIDRWVSVVWPLWAKVHRTQKLVRITAGIIWVLSLLWTGLIIYLLESFYIDSFRSQTINLISLVMMFVIPFLIIFISYVTIFFQLRNSNRPQRSQRPYRIITAVILCFFFCWAPYYICPLTSLSDGDIVQVNTAAVIDTILASLNSCINPIIYVFMGQDFRHGFLRSIPFRVERALTIHQDNPCNEQETPGPTPTTDG